MGFQNSFKLVTETRSQGRLSKISEVLSLEREAILYDDFFGMFIGLLMILLHQMQNANTQMREKLMRKKLKNIR